MSDESLEQLRTSKADKKVIKGIYNYEIITNQYYQKKYEFKTLNQRYTLKDYELSDVITQFLNLSEKCNKFVLENFKQD